MVIAAGYPQADNLDANMPFPICLIYYTCDLYLLCGGSWQWWQGLSVDAGALPQLFYSLYSKVPKVGTLEC